MKKKWYPAVLSVLLAGTMLAGCGSGGSNESQGSANGEPAKEKIKLTMWGAVPASRASSCS